jgi:hypothetical protein
MTTIREKAVQEDAESNIVSIPKIIHYCWFGTSKLPPEIKECIDSWKKLKGYKIIRWDENNCAFDENEFVKKAYSEKKYAFVSDYYRLKALYEYGGIYLDTDVIVKRDFGSLLKNKAFFGFSYNCCIGTAVIGSIKGNGLMASLLAMYDRTVFTSEKNEQELVEKDNYFHISEYVTNNYYITWYVLKNYPNFKLNNMYQDLKDFVIYPKEYFEIGSMLGKHFTIHLNTGSWKEDASKSKNVKDKCKLLLSNYPSAFETIQIIVRKPRYYLQNRKIPFFAYSKAQKRQKYLPLFSTLNTTRGKGETDSK